MVIIQNSARRRSSSAASECLTFEDLSYASENVDQYNKRLLKELQKSKSNAIMPIPYEYVGSDIRLLYGTRDHSINYPDWHMITPAYHIAYSGMSKFEHVKSLLNPNSGNFILMRIRRWIEEPKSIVYCNWLDKLASLISFLLLSMTSLASLWQVKLGVKITYVFTDDSVRSNFELLELNQLNELGNSTNWLLTKAILTFISGLIITWNVYKRTTLPKANSVKINNFSRKLVLSKTYPFVKFNKPLTTKTNALIKSKTMRSVIVPLPRSKTRISRISITSTA